MQQRPGKWPPQESHESCGTRKPEADMRFMESPNERQRYSFHPDFPLKRENPTCGRDGPASLPIPKVQEDPANYRFNKETPTRRAERERRLAASLRSTIEISINKNRPQNFFDAGTALSRPVLVGANSDQLTQLMALKEIEAFFSHKLKDVFKSRLKDLRFEDEFMLDGDPYDGADELFADLLLTSLSPLELLEKSKTCISFSKTLVKILQNKTEEDCRPFSRLVEAKLPVFIENSNTCYIVKCLIKICPPMMKKTCCLAVNNLDDMLHKVHTSRLVYTMCNHSPKFREKLLKIFKSRLMKLLSTLSGAILLGLLISNSEDISKFEFLLAEFLRNPEAIKNPFFSRAFASYMKLCPDRDCLTTLPIITKNISFLLHDKYGNYHLQNFYDRDFLPGIEMCNQALKAMYKKAFIRKYSRYILFKALEHPSGPQLALELLDPVTQDAAIVQNIIQRKVSQRIMLLALAKIKSRSSLLVLLERITHMPLTDLWDPEDKTESCNSLPEDLNMLKAAALLELQ